jgi:hypothetical protein
MSSVLQDILHEKVQVSLNGKRRKVSSETAILLRLTEKALSGDLRSIKTLFSLRAQHLPDAENRLVTESPEEDLQILWEAGVPRNGEEVRLGRVRRLRIEVPPRSLKSVCASVAFPAFLLGHDPTAKIITASYSADLAAKHAGTAARPCSHPGTGNCSRRHD